MRDRSKYLGGSDAAAACGFSKYGSPLQLWHEKTSGHVSPKSEAMEQAAYWGTRLEPEVLRAYAIRNGKLVLCRDVDGKTIGFEPDGTKLYSPHLDSAYVEQLPPLHHFTDKEHDFLAGEIDGIAFTPDDVLVFGRPYAYLDAKTASAFRDDFGDGPEDVPTEYYVQAQHYLGVIHRNGWLDLPLAMPVLRGGQKSLDYLIERNDAFFRILLQRELDFWECVTGGREPDPIALDDDFITEIHPAPETDEILEADEELQKLAEDFSQARERSKLAAKDESLYRARIKALTRSYAGAVGDGWKLSFRQNRSRDVVDWESAFSDVRLFFSLAAGIPDGTSFTAQEVLRKLIECESDHTSEKKGARPFRLTFHDKGD